MKILIVDDDEVTLQVMIRGLSQKGHEVKTAMKADEALHCINKEKPDLVIADVMMPYMSGLELLNIVNYEYLDAIPVILMSSLQNSEVINLSMDLGAVDYIPKPIDFRALLPKIERLRP